MGTDSLSAFLLARIAEDEWVHIAPRSEQKRHAAECNAKRRIVFRTSGWDMADDVPADVKEAMRGIQQLLALPYADHPEYREEWKL